MPVFPESLTRSLQSGTVIPFVGAGVSRSVMSNPMGSEIRRNLFPSWRELIFRAADRLKRENKEAEAALVGALLGVSPPRYLDAASEAQRGLGPRWAEFLKTVLDPPFRQADAESLRLARAVWALNSKLVITTNYDHVLRWSCPTPADCAEWDVQAPAEFAGLMRDGITKPTVWHLHGCIDNAAGIILTPDGYNRLYGSDSSRSGQFEAALRTLQSLLMSRTLLFLGFSFDDEHFAAQIQWLDETFEGCAGPHYLLVQRRELEGLKPQIRSLPIELLTFEEFGEPLTQTVEELASFTRSRRATTATIVNPIPQLRWRGGHFSEETAGLESYLERVNSRYLDLTRRVQEAVRRKSAELRLEPMWERHSEQVLAYLGQLIPDEIKAAELSEIEIACLCVLGHRTIELSLRRRGVEVAKELTAEVERVLSEFPELLTATGAVAGALLANQDVVFRSESVSETEAPQLDFLLACLRLVTEIDLALNRFPKLIYESFCPYHSLGEADFAADRFRIDRIDLNYNLHEIAIQATCSNPEIHQVLATLTDYLNQTLHAVGPPLDAKYISLLRVRLHVQPVGYEGQHHEFRTQVSTVISMFMGEELYGDQRVFLRELLQNARDAVLTRVGICRAAGQPFEPRIGFEFDRKTGILICRDNGIGMDRYTIERYLADVGRSFYTSDDYRNLVAGAKDEQESPVSRFGIGILSCFMVASKVSIRTRQEGKPGYRIEIPARGAFFFVREDSSVVDVGTEVRLDMLPGALASDAAWRRPLTNRLTGEVDTGVMVEDGGKMVPAGRLRFKTALVSKNHWKLPRLLAAYAANFPFSIEILEDGVRSLIPKRRLFQTVLDQEERVRLGRRRHWTFADTDLGECYVIVDDEAVRFKAAVLYNNSEVQVFSSGGIYVSTYRDFDLHSLGLPKWSGYVVDFAPERVRINLARSTILGFRTFEVETSNAWKRVEVQLSQLPLKALLGREKTKSLLDQSAALYQLVSTFPPQGKAFGKDLLLKNFHVFMFRFIGPDCEVWSSPLADFDGAGVRILYRISDEVRPDELGISIDGGARPLPKAIDKKPLSDRDPSPSPGRIEESPRAIDKKPLPDRGPSPTPGRIEKKRPRSRFVRSEGGIRMGYPDDRFKPLIERGKRRGFVTVEDLYQLLPAEADWTDEILKLIESLDGFGIELVDGIEVGSTIRNEVDEDEIDRGVDDAPEVARTPQDQKKSLQGPVGLSGSQGKVYLYASRFDEAAQFVGLSAYKFLDKLKAEKMDEGSTDYNGSLSSSTESPRNKANRELRNAIKDFLTFVTTAQPMVQWIRLERDKVQRHLDNIMKCQQALRFVKEEEKKLKKQMDLEREGS
jgi:hypothetical protein